MSDKARVQGHETDAAMVALIRAALSESLVTTPDRIIEFALKNRRLRITYQSIASMKREAFISYLLVVLDKMLSGGIVGVAYFNRSSQS